MKNLEQEVFTLTRQVASLQRQIARTEQLLDVLASPPWKRLWFVLQGWHPYKLDRRWYYRRGGS